MRLIVLSLTCSILQNSLLLFSLAASNTTEINANTTATIEKSPFCKKGGPVERTPETGTNRVMINF